MLPALFLTNNLQAYNFDHEDVILLIAYCRCGETSRQDEEYLRKIFDRVSSDDRENEREFQDPKRERL